MYKAEGSFARTQLEKYGWKEGAGLGSNEQGMSEAIRAKIKHDNTGVGHDHAKDFKNHWWDRAFNRAAASLVVEDGENGVVVKKKKEPKKKERTEVARKALYGNFVKSSLLSNGTETSIEKEGAEPDSSDDEFKSCTPTLLLPDEELLRACGGRTAHKAARHGLKLTGKLARLQEQERLMQEKLHSSSNSSSPITTQPTQNGETTDPVASTQGNVPETPKSKKKKKSKKRIREEREDDEVTEKGDHIPVSAGEETQSVEQSEDGVSSTKKKRKKRRKEKSETDDENGSAASSSNFQDLEEEPKKKKKKEKRRDRLESNESGFAAENGSSRTADADNHVSKLSQCEGGEVCTDMRVAEADCGSVSPACVAGEGQESRRKCKKKKKKKVQKC